MRGSGPLPGSGADPVVVVVLLVEDDIDDATLVRRHLSADDGGKRYRMIHVERLDDAAESLRHERIDVVLLDLSLHASRGLDTFLAVRGLADAVPILVLSGCDDEETANACIEAGAQHYLRKAEIQPLTLRRAIGYAVSRYRAEMDRQRATERLDRFFDLSGDLLSIAGTDGYFTRLNPAWERTLGFRIAELTAVPYLHFIHPDDVARTAAEAAEQLLRGVTVEFENRYRCSDGSYRWLSWNATVSAREGLIYAVARDNTALREALAVAASDRLRLRRVSEAGKLFGSSLELDVVLGQVAVRTSEALGDLCMIRLLDADGDLLLPAAMHHTDPAREDILLLAGLNRPIPAADGVFRAVLQTGKPVLVGSEPSATAEQRPGAPLSAEFAAAGLHSVLAVPMVAAGRARGILMVARDVTPTPYDETDLGLCTDLADRGAQAIHNAQLMADVLHADANRADAEERMRQAERMQGLGHLAGGIAHDFNNLLGVISLSAELAAGDVPAGGEAADSLAMITDATDRAADLTQQLLLFSRSEPGESTVLDVGEVLTDVEHLLARTIGEKVELELRLGAGPMLVLADQTRLDQVVMNLAVNARDAMPGGGVMRIAAARISESDRDTGDDSPSSWVRIAVTDTGTGMTEEVRSKALEPFFTTKGPGKGTGLGLATVHGIVADAGGTLRIESAPGAGTTIEVRLRAVEPSETVTPKPVGRRAPAAPLPAGAEHILVVEDEERLREPLRRLLVQCGFTVTLAADGNSALALLDAGLVVDIVLTDVIMPRLTGPELAQALTERRLGLPVMFMSGYTDGEATADIDPAHLVHKPFRVGELLNALDRVLAATQLTTP